MSKNKGNSFLVFLAGAAAGALAGILYAPDKGKHTRDKLTYRLDKYKEELQTLIDDLVEGKAVASSAAKEKGRQVVDDAISQAEKLMNEFDMLKEKISADTEEEENEEA